MQGLPLFTHCRQAAQTSVTYWDRHLLPIATSLSKRLLAAKQHAVRHISSHIHVTAAGASMHWHFKVVPAHNLLTQSTYN